MSEHDPRSEETIFSTALLCAPAERAAYLDQACAGQPVLRQRIEDLLKARPQVGEFMEIPVLPGTAEREADIFNTARKIPLAKRALYLDAACAEDALLRQRVEELLQANAVAAVFLPELGTGAANPTGRGAASGPGASFGLSASPSEEAGDTIGAISPKAFRPNQSQFPVAPPIP